MSQMKERKKKVRNGRYLINLERLRNKRNARRQSHAVERAAKKTAAAQNEVHPVATFLRRGKATIRSVRPGEKTKCHRGWYRKLKGQLKTRNVPMTVHELTALPSNKMSQRTARRTSIQKPFGPGVRFLPKRRLKTSNFRSGRKRTAVRIGAS